jgi:hypothetical protein
MMQEWKRGDSVTGTESKLLGRGESRRRYVFKWNAEAAAFERARPVKWTVSIIPIPTTATIEADSTLKLMRARR